MGVPPHHGYMGCYPLSRLYYIWGATPYHGYMGSPVTVIWARLSRLYGLVPPITVIWGATPYHGYMGSPLYYGLRSLNRNTRQRSEVMLDGGGESSCVHANASTTTSAQDDEYHTGYDESLDDPEQYMFAHEKLLFGYMA